jgi:hypothetical protein
MVKDGKSYYLISPAAAPEVEALSLPLDSSLPTALAALSATGDWGGWIF